jgi:hypothetical protein
MAVTEIMIVIVVMIVGMVVVKPFMRVILTVHICVPDQAVGIQQKAVSRQLRLPGYGKTGYGRL